MLDSYASLVKIRRKIFEEVARLGYEGGDYSRVDEIPYKLFRGQPVYRDFRSHFVLSISVFLRNLP